MKIKEQAKIFLKKHKIKQLDNQQLKNIIRNQGFEILEFGEWADDYEETSSLIKNLKLEHNLELKNSFLFDDKNSKIVFIKAGLGEEERLILLSHEEGHVFLGHSREDLVDPIKEAEANEFSYHIRKYDGNKINQNRNIIAIAVAVVLFLGLLTIPIIKSIANKNTPTTTNNSTSTSTNTSTVTTANTYSISDTTKSLNPNEQVFITETGKKFHREDCQYIKDKTNLKIYIIKEAEELGYSACEKCFE